MKNKKGQLALLFSIPGLIMMLIVIAAAILLVVKVIEYKFIILGSTLLIMSSFYGIKHGFDKTSGKIVLSFGGVGLIILMLAASGVIQTQTDFSADEIYLPNYVTIWCDRLPGEVQGDITFNDKTSSTCGYSGDGPNPIAWDTFDGCQYTSTETFLKYEIHEPNYDCSQIGIFGWDSLVQNGVLTVPVGKKLCLNEDTWGSSTIKYSAVKYGLRINNANGKVIFNKNCDLASNYNDIDEIDYIPGISSSPLRMTAESSAVYWINGYSAVVNDKDVVDFNGNQIYIYQIGRYYPIVTSKAGIKYANSLASQSSSSLICVPSQNPLCIDGVELEKEIEDVKCSLTNQPEGYVLQGDGTECEYSCSGSKLVKGDCRTIKECSGDTPYRNPYTNKCEAVNDFSQSNKVCGFAQHSVVKNEVITKWYNHFGIGQPETIPYDDCVADSWVVLVIFGSFMTIVILGGMIIYKKKVTTKTKKKRK